MVIFNIVGHYVFTIEKVYKMPIFRKYQYSNTVKVMIFISNIKSYLKDKFKIRQMIRSRPLLLHLMLKQGQTWYPLSNV